MIKDPSKAVKIGEASKILGLHIDTLRRWEKSGKISPIRTPGGTRLYSLDELKSLIPKVLVKISKSPSTKIKQIPVKHLQEKDKEDIYVHVYNKGVDKRIIFNDREDFKVFLGFLGDYLTAPQDPESIKKDFKIHGRTFQGTPHQPNNYLGKVELIAYNLMSDHFHLLLHQITGGSIENFLRSLCTRYSMYFNKKYQRSGALFQGPYKLVKISNGPQLLHLTRYLHYTGNCSSYLEYLGVRETSWVKPKVALSWIGKGKDEYKNFVEKNILDQEDKGFLAGITIEEETKHLEGRDTGNEEILPDYKSKPHSRVNEFVTISATVFVLLVTLGVRNITISTPPAVLGQVEEMTTAPDAIVKPKMVTVKIDDGATSVYIHQEPTISSKKIGEAKNGDSFELVSINSEWYEIKLTDGSTGFISAEYVKEGANY